jgi:hypothetical protein
MSRHMRRYLKVGLLMLLVSMAACGGDDDPATPDTPAVLDLHFKLNVDGAPLQLNTSAQQYTSPSGTKYGIRDLRFIVSDVTLHNDEGGAIVVKSVHYVNVNDPTTQTIHYSGIPHANYTRVTFTFGLNASRNVRGFYPAIPNIMEWPTDLGADLGYHYMQLEGNYEQTPGGGSASYTTHTGARHLDGNSPLYPGIVDDTAHHFAFDVSAGFTPAHVHEGGHGQLDITFNLNGWYMDHTPGDGVDTQYVLTSLPIMGDLDAQAKLSANGPGCFTARMVAHGGYDD